jgi:methylthioribulose-1-phosphate dehydratase
MRATAMPPRAPELIQAAATELIAAGRDFAARSWVPATSGNFSSRIDARTMAVTLSGRDKGALTPEDFVAVAIDAPPPPGVSAEAPLHALMYRLDSAIGAVLHVHSLTATLASLAYEAAGTVELHGYEMLKAFRGVATHEARIEVPVFPNDQDIPRLARQVEARLKPGIWGYLIAGHGLYAWGRDVAEARRHVEAFDFLLACERERTRRPK